MISLASKSGYDTTQAAAFSDRAATNNSDLAGAGVSRFRFFSFRK